MKKLDKFVIGFSGGACSRAMVHLLADAVKVRSSKVQFFDMHVVFVDCSSVMTASNAEQQQQVMQMLQTKYGPHCASIAAHKVENVLFAGNVQQAHAYLNSFVTASAKEDALHQLIMQSLYHLTLHVHQCKKLVLGESANRLAARVLTDISKGRGFMVPVQSSDMDNHLQGIFIIFNMLFC